MIYKLQGRIHNWLDKYFPEFLTVFKDWSGKMALATLEHIPLPVQLNQITPERVAEIWSTYEAYNAQAINEYSDFKRLLHVQ